MATYHRDFAGEGSTSFSGTNLYAHPAQHGPPGSLVHMYYATRNTTLWEATLPFRYVVGFLFVAKGFDMLIRKRFPKFTFLKTGRLNWWVFGAIVLLFSIDDIGTAVGMQAKESPHGGYEMNPGFCIFMEYLIINGYVRTHTSGFRIVWVFNMLLLGALQYFGWFSPLVATWMAFNAGVKAVAGGV